MRRGKEREKKDLGQQYKQGNGTSMVVRLRISASLVISNFLFKGVLDVDFQMNSLKETEGYVIFFFFSTRKTTRENQNLTLNPLHNHFLFPHYGVYREERCSVVLSLLGQHKAHKLL